VQVPRDTSTSSPSAATSVIRSSVPSFANTLRCGSEKMR
jgi:hypothetical protein